MTKGELVVPIATINDTRRDFECLFSMREQLLRESRDVVFDFRDASFLRQNAVAFIGGLSREIQVQGRNVTFAWDSMKVGVLANLQQNGFVAAFGGVTPPWVGNSIPYREDPEENGLDIAHYLGSRWLGRDWVHMSPELNKAIVGRMYEIYANAFEHSGSQVGVFSCGQHYPSLGLLKLTVVDYGIGIPASVQTLLGSQIGARGALSWAFKEGNTTKEGGYGRGLGLDLLKKFIRLNDGHLEVYSNDAFGMLRKGTEAYLTSNSYLRGTAINVTLRCDESHYQLGSEEPPAVRF